MELPCKKCIIKVNCSEKCQAFNNHQTIIKNALDAFHRYKGKLTPYQRQQVKYYKRLHNEISDVSHEIFVRGLEKSMDNMFN